MKKQGTTWTRVILTLVVLALLVVNAYQPSLAEEIENLAQDELVQNDESNLENEEDLLLDNELVESIENEDSLLDSEDSMQASSDEEAQSQLDDPVQDDGSEGSDVVEDSQELSFEEDEAIVEENEEDSPAEDLAESQEENQEESNVPASDSDSASNDEVAEGSLSDEEDHVPDSNDNSRATEEVSSSELNNEKKADEKAKDNETNEQKPLLTSMGLNESDKESENDESGPMMMSSPASPNPLENVTAIYLNGTSGDDEKFGETKGAAVKTFARAKELATQYANIKTIYVTGTVLISGEISLEGTNAILKREAEFNGYLLQVSSGTTATLTNITVDGNSEEAKSANSALINCSGTLNVKEGTVLENNKIASRTARRLGGAINCSGGTINMTAGNVQNNSAMWGGGLYLTDNTIFNMSGGTIQHNQAINGPNVNPYNNSIANAAAGGGVCLFNGAMMNFSGGLIKGNSSREVGGGISVGTIEASENGDNRLIMTGGKIEENSAGAGGGGIFVQAAYVERVSSATILAGYITRNSMNGVGLTNKHFGGGGIYVNGYKANGFKNGHLFLRNVVVSDNTAQVYGGGYAACPITDTKIFITDGGAIYGNSTVWLKGRVAKDIFIYSQTVGYGAHGGNPEYFVTDTMLGGVPYRWKTWNDADAPAGDLEGTLIGEGVALALHTDQQGDDNTKRLAKVFITKNTSTTAGAGIGSNGNVTIGTDQTIDLKIRKNWVDQNNKWEKRPEKVEIEVWRKIKNGKPVHVSDATMVPDENGDWSLEITKLAKDDGLGNIYEYSIKEKSVSGYSGVITGDVTNGFVITNSISGTVSVNGAKTWNDANNQDGKRPKSITINLYKKVGEGEATLVESKIVKPDASGDWAWSFADLPKYEDGFEVIYSITEDAVAEYKSVINGYNVTNSYTPGKISIDVEKRWNDHNDVAGFRPESVTIHLLADKVDTGKRLVLSEDVNWKGAFTDLDEYKDGVAIVYSVEEVGVDKYTTEYSGDKVQGFIVTNTHIPSKISIDVEKRWNDHNDVAGFRPESVTIRLLADKVDTGKRLVLSEDVNWKGAFTDLDEYKDGVAIVYSVEEEDVDKYTTDYSGDQRQGFVVTNSHTPGKISIDVEKRWDDHNNVAGFRPDSVTIRLLADKVDTGKRLVLSEDVNWKGAFTDLDEYKDGVAIVYSVEEEDVDKYTTEYSGDQRQGFVVTNSHTPVLGEEAVSVSGKKTWNDANDQDGMRPKSITIRLFANGKEADSVKVTEADGWEWTIADLAKYDESGKEIAYTISEDKVDGYTTTVNGYDVTNTHVPSKVSVKVTKFWEDHDNEAGTRPDSVTIKLLADGVDTDKTLILSDNASWIGEFTDLNEYKDGKKISYTVEEDDIEGYTPEITGDADEGFVVMNCPELGEEYLPKTGESRSIYWLPGVGFIVAGGLLLLALRRKARSEG